MGDQQAAVKLRLATYNIHKCKGMDGRVLPDRIAEVLIALDADVIALQEVLSISSGVLRDDQAAYLQSRLPAYTVHVGENRILRGGSYGNVTLSRLPVTTVRNYDVTEGSREERGVLRTDVIAGGERFHIFNAHLGTSFLERRAQAEKLLSTAVLLGPEFQGRRIVCGDFNEWTRGLCTRRMCAHFRSVGREALGRRRTFPGVIPLLHLDHIYHDAELRLVGARWVRDRLTLIASDHLPIVADFVVP